MIFLKNFGKIYIEGKEKGLRKSDFLESEVIQMAKYKGIFERYLEAMAKTGDAVLAYQYQKEMFKQSLMDREEREALI